MSRSLPFPPIMIITDRQPATAPLPELAGPWFEQGLRWISLREKNLPADQQAALLNTLSLAARPHAALVGLHADAELALHIRAIGGIFNALHLPDGADAVAARQALGPDILIGQSRHQTSAALTADQAAALDYITLSPVHASASKPGYGPLITTDGLTAFAATSDLPVIALGGITTDNLAQTLASGAAGVAVMGEVMRQPEKLAEFVRGLGMATAHPAVSVLPVRDSIDGKGGVEVLVIRRNRNLAFAGGAIVFPGGRIDAADGPAGLEDTRRTAALRELAEECGLSLPGPAAHRALQPLCRFITPINYPRRFDTWFYLLDTPADFIPVADGSEAVEAGWARPAELIAEASAGRITLMFATWLILQRLSEAGSLRALWADAERHPVVALTATKVDSGAQSRFTIPSDMGFSLTELRFDALGKI